MDTEQGTHSPEYVQALQEANRMNSELLASLSHDLRTPLNGILGFTEFLLDEKPGPLNPRQKEYLGDVLSSGQQLLQLINDMVDLAKIEAGRMQLQSATFPLPAAIDEALGSVSHSAAQKRIMLRRYVEPGLVMVTLDRGKLMQVLINLLSNAVKLTDKGEVALRLTLEDQKLRLQVSDTASGIERNDFGKLFMEFQQLDGGSARRFSGAGLALALTRRIIQLQGGTLEVTSGPGQGSTVTVILPVQVPTP